MVKDITMPESEEIIIEGKFNSRRVWLTLLICSVSGILLAVFSLSKANPRACFVLCLLSLLLSILGSVAYIRDSRVKLEVTKHCIYRKTILGRHTYLPIDEICAVDKKWLGSVSFYTRVGKFDCALLDNKDDVFLAIKELLDARQLQSK